MRAVVNYYAVLLFCMFTVALTFTTYGLPLPDEGRAVGFATLVVFIPSIVAILLTVVTEGGAGVRALLGQLTHWCGGWKWFIIAVGLGLALRLVVSPIALLLGWITRIDLSGFSPLLISVLIFAAARELGWRGYALPRLLKLQSLLAASLILGLSWGFLHLALFLPGMMSQGLPAIPQLLVIMAMSVMTAWFFVRAGRGGVIAATLLHGAQNFFVFANTGIDSTRVSWLMVIVYVVAAVVIVVANRQLSVFRSETLVQSV